MFLAVNARWSYLSRPLQRQLAFPSREMNCWLFLREVGWYADREAVEVGPSCAATGLLLQETEGGPPKAKLGKTSD